MLKENVIKQYQKKFEPLLLEEILSVGISKSIKAGTVLLDIGNYVKSIPLLIKGVIKILREDNDGYELLLYYLEKGDTCSMTMACCLEHQKSEIKAVAETDIELMMIPVSKMEEWSGKYKSWRTFVFSSYNERLNELFEAIDSIAFKKLDERLLDYLSEKNRISKSRNIYITHQEIAYDMHTSRVVISRLLKKLEQLNHIKLNRNYIEIINI